MFEGVLIALRAPGDGPPCIRNGAQVRLYSRPGNGKQRRPRPPDREDCTLLAWYRSIYAPRTGGAHDSHHRTAGIAGRTRRRGSRVAARGARAAGRAHAAHWSARAAGGLRSGNAGAGHGLRAREQQLGWPAGRNVRIDYRWGAGDADRIGQQAAELAALAPDAILTVGASTTAPMLRATRTVPVVFVAVVDPVGAGYVDSLARPGGNATGFTNFEYSIGAKWLELLNEIAPAVTRAAVIRDPDLSLGAGQFSAVQTAAPSLGIEARPVNVRDPSEIERAIAAFARSGNGGLIVTGSGLAGVHRHVLISLAARHKLPAVYFEPYFVTAARLSS